VNDDDEREAITAAMARLFAGTPTRSSGNLDILTLAQEAGLRRNKLTHRHTDLEDQFCAQRAARAGVSQREIKFQDQIADLETRNATLRKERDDHRAANEAFARALHIVTVENDNLRKDLANTPSCRWRGPSAGAGSSAIAQTTGRHDLLLSANEGPRDSGLCHSQEVVSAAISLLMQRYCIECCDNAVEAVRTSMK
jgi:hypothetical protein